MSLETLNQIADASRPVDSGSALIAGRMGTGKTFLATTMPKPVVVFYADRPQGDKDLVAAAKNGVFRIYLKRGNVEKSFRDFLGRIATGDLSHDGIKSITLDSALYLQKLAEIDEVPGGGQVSIKKSGNIVRTMDRMLNDFLHMPQHRLILSHLKRKEEEEVVDGEKITVVSWVPDVMPAIREIMMQQVTLMGYTWRVDKEGEASRYGVTFGPQVRSRGHLFRFIDAKAPSGWGSEPADFSQWVERLYPPKGKDPDPVPGIDPAPTPTSSSKAIQNKQGESHAQA